MSLKSVLPQLKPILFTLILLLGVTMPAAAGPAFAAPLPNVALPAARLLAPALNPGAAPGFDLLPDAAAVGPAASIVVPAFTYSWTQTWGGANGEADAGSVAADTLGDVFVAGQYQGTVNFDPARLSPHSTFTSTYGSFDAFLTKFNAAGQYQWTRVWGSGFITDTTCLWMGCGRDSANGVGVDNLGNAYVSGLFHGAVDMGSDIIITSSAVPDAHETGGYNNIMVAKFASDGTTVWARAWGGTTGGESYSMVVDAAHQVLYVEGDWSTGDDNIQVDFNPSGAPRHDLHKNHGMYDAFLSKFDLDGNFQWANTWGGDQYDDGPGVAVDATGNIYVCGMYGSQNIDFDPAGRNLAGLAHPASDSSPVLLDIFLTKFAPDGTWQWVRTWGGKGTEDAGGPVAVDQAGNVYAGGRFSCANCNFQVGANGPIVPGDIHSTNGSFDAFVSKFAPDGTFLWADTWGGPNADMAGPIALDSAANLYVGGSANGVRDPKTFVYTSSEGMLRKISSDGALQWEKDWGSGGANSVWAMNPLMDSADNLYLVGDFQGTLDFSPDGTPDIHSAVGPGDSSLTLFASKSFTVTASVFLPLVGR